MFLFIPVQGFCVPVMMSDHWKPLPLRAKAAVIIISPAGQSGKVISICWKACGWASSWPLWKNGLGREWQTLRKDSDVHLIFLHWVISYSEIGVFKAFLEICYYTIGFQIYSVDLRNLLGSFSSGNPLECLYLNQRTTDSECLKNKLFQLMSI